MKPLDLINQRLQGEIDPGFAARASFIAAMVEESKAESILDVGCGRGFYLKLLSIFPFVKKLTGVEIRADYADKARELTKDDNRIAIVEGSIYELPFKNNSFDLIICSEVLEHLENDMSGLVELNRVLKPGGKIIITVPNKNFPFLWDPLNALLAKFGRHISKDIWWLAGIWADHERLYSPDEIETLIKKSGLKVITVNQFVHWCWPFSHFILYGLGKNIVEKLGGGTMNRFNFDPPGVITLFLSNLMRAPETLNKVLPVKNSMNIGLLVEKTNLKR